MLLLTFNLLFSFLRSKPADLKKEILIVGRFPDETERQEEYDSFTVTEKNYKSKSFVHVSKVHFEIVREPGDTKLRPAFIQVVGTNGVYLNMCKLLKGHMRILADGDQICVTRSRQMFEFKYSDRAEESDSLPKVLLDKFFISDTIGAGGCGTVRLVRDRESGKKLAMKIIKKEVNPMIRNQKEANDKIMNEVKIMRRLRHPNVVNLVDCFETQDTVVIIMDYMEGKDLLHRIIHYGGTKCLSESEAKFFFLQACNGLKYLHQNGITHRDIKPDNILLATMKGKTLLKISDFGLSKILTVETMKTVCGTQLYVAPEVLKGEKYSNKVDIWSLGCLLFAMLSGSVPFSPEYKPHDLNVQIKKGIYSFHRGIWGNVSENAKQLISHMLQVDVQRRYSVDNVLAHKWLDCKKTRELVRRLETSDHTITNGYSDSELEVTLNNVSLNETPKPPPSKKRRVVRDGSTET